MKKLPFTGAGVAIVTPFCEDGSINYERLKDLLEFHIAHKTDAIIICGTTGEAATLSDQEHREIVKFTVDTVAHRIPVIAGTGSNDTAYSVDLSQQAEQDGADGLLLVTPYYNKCSQTGLVAHFNAIADSVNIPCIVYNVPGRTGVTISIAAYKELAKNKNIVAAKEASGNISAIAELAAACGDELYIYSGDDDQILPIMSLGGKGVISVLANILPEETHNICQAFLDGDIAKSRELQLKYLDLASSLFIEVNPIPVKAAMNLMGMEAGGYRLPLCAPTDANLEKIRSVLNTYGLLS